MAVEPIQILLVEDDPYDIELTLHALTKNRVANRIQVVRDGAEALEYLFRMGRYEGRAEADKDAQEAFSNYFMEMSPVMFPAIFAVAGNARSLLEKVPTIHKQWPSAVSAKDFKEKLFILESTDERLVFKYESPNKLCGVLRMVAERVLTHYGEKGTVTETLCALDGGPWCQVEVQFEPLPLQA